MKLNNAELLVFWLSLVCFSTLQLAQSWDVEYTLNMLCKQGKTFYMQEIIWYVSESIDATNSGDVEELIISLDQCLGFTQTVITNNTDIRLIKSENRKIALNIVFCTATDDPIIQVYDRTALGRHMYFGLIIMVNIVEDFSVAEQLLLDLHSHNFINTLLYYYSSNRTNELFGYSLYPEYHLQNRSNFLEYVTENFEKVWTGGVDMLGYKLYTPLREDLPHVFSYKNSAGQTYWRGSAYNLLKLFTDYYNASLVKYEMPKDHLGGNVIDMKSALDLIRHKKVDVMAHAYALFKEDDELGKSYPLMVVRWCLMVPIWNSVTTMYYPLEPFDDLVWFIIVGVFFALVSVKCLWCCWQSTHQLASRLSDTVLECFCLMIGIGTPNYFGAPTVLDFLIFTTIYFYGFFLIANYTSLLGSIFTVNLFHAQINTMDDLIETNISVMIIDYELEFLLSEGDELPANFSRLLLPVDPATFAQHQVQLNTSFAYFITEEKWNFLEIQQKYLKRRLFKFSDICFGSYHLAYPLQPDSVLYRNLEYFIYRMHSSGMLGHYQSTAFDYAVHARLVRRLADNAEFTSAGMQHLLVIFLMLLAMCCISFCVFVGELIIVRLLESRSHGHQ
ncbi:PREDICTED: uncharacterized protein LOC108972663 [Bactrocera latifrons]|uniref:uncharacterized protein LOC108972663 n=1 Tax=Bactrocera latifrons TaxID=174628 RepID=UPI0008DD664E|nr:PREDICTED: uncharacterized protein LOC108972663 [Bactrocera latifrons]